MFHRFESQEERRAFGGSAFIEIQYCRCQKGMAAEEIVSADSIKNWEEDSLYVTDGDMNEFFDQYAAVLGWETGMKLFAVSYYSCEQTADIMDAVTRLKPIGYEKLINWLKYAKERYNGFYILGI